MIEVSREFLQQVGGDNRNFLYYMDFVLANNTALHLTNQHLWQSGIILEDAVSNENALDVGSCIINQCTIVLDNINEQFDQYDFDDAKVTLSIGLTIPGATENDPSTIERFQKGVYTVDNVMNDSSLITLTCLDNMVKFDADFDPNQFSFPINIRTLVSRICSIRSVSDAIAYTNLPLWDLTFESFPFATDSISYRDVIAWAAQINGVNARINRMGELEFIWYDRGTLEIDSALIGSTVDPEYLFVDSESEDDELLLTQDRVGILLNYPIFNRLTALYSINAAKFDTVITGVKVIVRNDVADQNALNEYVVGTNEYMIVIDTNGLVTDANAQQVAEAVASHVLGMQYRKAAYTHIGYPTMEAGDICFIYDGKNRLYRTLVSSTTFTAGDQQSTFSAGETPSVNMANRYSESTKNFVKTKELTDKTFNSLQERINNSSGLYTTEESDGQGGTIYYLHDKPQLSQSMIIWKMTAEAWGVSTDGGQTYKYGMTVDGDTIVRILSAEGISANWIESGVLKSRNNRSYYDLDNGYFFLESQSGLSRVIFRGISASIVLQHRTSTDDDWNISIEMGTSSSVTYAVGTIYFSSQGNSNITMERFNIGTYSDAKVFAYIDDYDAVCQILDNLRCHTKIELNSGSQSPSPFLVKQPSTGNVPDWTVCGKSTYGSYEAISFETGYSAVSGNANEVYYNEVMGFATLNFFIDGVVNANSSTVVGTISHGLPLANVTGACSMAVNGLPQYARVTLDTSGNITIWTPVQAAVPHGSISYRISGVGNPS